MSARHIQLIRRSTSVQLDDIFRLGTEHQVGFHLQHSDLRLIDVDLLAEGSFTGSKGRYGRSGRGVVQKPLLSRGADARGVNDGRATTGFERTQFLRSPHNAIE